MAIVVSIIKVGSEVRTFDVSDNPTLSNALSKVNEQFVQNAITINTNSMLSPDTRLNDGDRIFIGNKVKGNIPYTVEFIRLGQGEVIRVSAEGDTTIAQCINMMTSDNKAKFLNAEGKDVFQYQVGGSQKNSEDIIAAPQTDNGNVRVICAAKVKGN